MWQGTPLATVLHHVEDSVDYLTPVMLAWAAFYARRRQVWRNYSPLFIIEVSRVDFSGLISTHTLSLPDYPLFA